VYEMHRFLHEDSDNDQDIDDDDEEEAPYRGGES